MGRAINMENHLQALETRLKLVEDALEEMIQTRVHHVDLTEDLNDEMNLEDHGVTVKPDEEFTAPVGKRKSTPKTTKSKTATVG